MCLTRLLYELGKYVNRVAQFWTSESEIDKASNEAAIRSRITEWSSFGKSELIVEFNRGGGGFTSK